MSKKRSNCKKLRKDYTVVLEIVCLLFLEYTIMGLFVSASEAIEVFMKIIASY
jgi:hypothetical protein